VRERWLAFGEAPMHPNGAGLPAASDDLGIALSREDWTGVIRAGLAQHGLTSAPDIYVSRTDTPLQSLRSWAWSLLAAVAMGRRVAVERKAVGFVVGDAPPELAEFKWEAQLMGLEIVSGAMVDKIVARICKVETGN
jgi:hypothetical protein